MLRSAAITDQQGTYLALLSKVPTCLDILGWTLPFGFPHNSTGHSPIFGRLDSSLALVNTLYHNMYDSMCNDMCSIIPTDMHTNTKTWSHSSASTISKVDQHSKAVPSQTLKHLFLARLFDNRQIVVCGSLQAVIAQSHRAVPQRHTEWCVPVRGVVHFDRNGAPLLSLTTVRSASPSLTSLELDQHCKDGFRQNSRTLISCTSASTQKSQR